MTNKKKKRIFGGIAFLCVSTLALILTVPKVNAEPTYCGGEESDSFDIEGECGISFSFATNPDTGEPIVNQYVLNMGSRCSGTFDAVIYDDTQVGTDFNPSVDLPDGAVKRNLGTFTAGSGVHNITVSEADYSFIASSATVGIAIHLKSNEAIDIGSCAYRGMKGFFYAGKVSGGILTDPEPADPAPDPTLTGEGINCSEVDLNGTSFESRFCKAKLNTLPEYSHNFASGRNYNTDHSGEFLSFKCSDDISKIPTDPRELEGEKYYLNKNYVYGSSVYRESTDYIYNYSKSNPKSETASCEVTCEEAVEVEYGPPVASKAGMCFEYKVRVTSRTSCYMSAPPPKPNPPSGYCTPVPVCVSSGGGVYNQGGPNEAYDACIQQCDKGKYSKYCSNKCYKQIYGNAIAGAKVATNDFMDVIASKVVTSGGGNDAACTYDRGGGGLTWSCGSSQEGRWYAEGNWSGSSPKSEYELDDNGIYRHRLRSGGVCQDRCSWTGCGGDVYLNPGQDQIDYSSNLEKYENLLNSCQGQATCSTETAEVSISVDYYKKKDNTKQTIEFPFSRGKDSVTHNPGGTVSLPDDEDSIILPNDPTTGEGVLGCYKPGASETNLYRLTWSFPGTWINNKSGEISYKRIGECGGANSKCTWQEQREKFCLPNNVGRVNADWWNAWNKRIIDEKSIDTSIDEPEVQEKCLKTTYDTIKQPGPVDISNEDYNIHAKAVKFGYFAWNIKMECFYATNSTPLVPASESVPSNIKEECKVEPDNYRIRSIDLENVFPAKDGSILSDPSSTGRTPGHNWTKYSNVLDKASYNNPLYFGSTGNPIEYLTKIQTKKDAIYDDDVEYQFYLSPKKIRKIRNDSSTMGYTNFDENSFYIDKNGVARYYSQTVRNLDIAKVINNNKTGGLTCNNMKGHGDSCE